MLRLSPTLCYPAVWLLVDLHVNELLLVKCVAHIQGLPHTCQTTCLLAVSEATWESRASCRPTTLSHLLINEITCCMRRSQTNLSGGKDNDKSPCGCQFVWHLLLLIPALVFKWSLHPLQSLSNSFLLCCVVLFSCTLKHLISSQNHRQFAYGKLHRGLQLGQSGAPAHLP